MEKDKSSYVASTNCSACGLHKRILKPHPLLDVPVCLDCLEDHINNGSYGDPEDTSEGASEIFCRWCGEGDKDGILCLCDSCPKGFCSGCIRRNFGLAECTRIIGLENRWSCFLCSPQSLEDLCESNGWSQPTDGGSIV